MLQVWGHSSTGVNFESNCNCIPVILRPYAEGASVMQGKYAYFVSGIFGRYTGSTSEYTCWLDDVEIDQRILHHIHRGDAIVVVDDTAESFSDHEISGTLERFAQRHHLNAGNFVFATNNLNFPQKNYCDVYSAPFSLEYCRYTIVDKDPDFFNPIMTNRGDWQYPFISIGGEPREHRRLLHNKIRETYPDSGICTMNNGFRGTGYSNIPFTPEQSPYELDHNEPFIWHTVNPSHYIHIPVAAVMETYIEANKRSITEKIFKNLVYPQPFVALAATGTIKTLRDLGFNMYDEYVDHSYDTILESYARIDAVFESFTKLIGNYDFPNEKNIAQHNRNIARNLTIARDYCDYLKQKLN